MNQHDSLTLTDNDLVCYNHFEDIRAEPDRYLFIQYYQDALPAWCMNVKWYIEGDTRPIEVYQSDNGKLYAREPNV